MNSFIKLSLIGVAVALSTGCTRIETGEVGVRLNGSKQIEGAELVAGGFYQTIIGSILTFPIKDVMVNLDNKTPMTADNSPLADFDITLEYSINPTTVAELYASKNKSYHTEFKGDIYLMHAWMTNVVNNASYKAVREYKSLEVADNRVKIEQQIKALVDQHLQEAKLGTQLTINNVSIRNILPNADILKSATEYVKAQNELKIKETEVQIAKKESERMAALSANSGTSIAYMSAQANMKIAEGIANGKVQTIVVPMDFKGMVNVGK